MTDLSGLSAASAKFFTDVSSALRTSPQLCASVNAVFQFVITGTGSYYVDLKHPPGRVHKGTSPGADVTLTYSSEKVFIDLNQGTMAASRAVFMGKLKISGNMKLLGKLMTEVKAAQTEQAARARALSAAGPDVASPSSSPSKKVWMSDKDASHCLGCRAVFSFLRRKHHCRLCGQIFCDDCSSGSYRGQRACDACIKQATKLRRMVATGTTPVFGAATGPGVLMGELTAIGPSREAETPGGVVRVPSARSLLPGTGPADLDMSRTSSVAPPDAGEVANVGDVEGGGSGVASEDVAALNARIDALQALVDTMTLEQSVAPAYDAQTPSPFFVLRHSPLIAAMVYPLLLLLSYLGWRVVPVALFSFVLLGVLSSSWWYGYTAWFLAAAGGGALVYIARAPTQETFRRRMYVYGMAFAIWCDYRVVRRQTDALDDQESEVIWSIAHKRNAAEVYHLMITLQGFWIKLGQYLSTRNDLMPEEYITVLSKLQDRVKARDYDSVKATIEEDFKRPILDIFKSFEPKSLAAASIAQVHKGVLHDGTVVAVKVQHRGMHNILLNDIVNLEKLMSWIALVEPSADFKKAIDEWGGEVLKELDFKNEATNLIEIRKHLKQSGLPVTVPAVIPDLVSGSVLVMRFIDGQKLNDTMLLNRPGFDQRALVKSVCEGIAYQLYITGVFTGDPHPGNIMVAKRESLIDWEEEGEQADAFRRAVGDNLWVPVLIDFGLTKRISTKMRLAFAKMVVSAEVLDYGGILDSHQDMGLILSRESATDDMESLLYSFRKAKKGKQARQDFKNMAAKKSERERKEKEDGFGKRQVQQWPSELVFFLRTVELLQGICSMTGHQLMESMTLMARRALMANVGPEARLHVPVNPSRGLASAPRASPLEAAVRRCLEGMVRTDSLLGIQVSVWQGRAVQIDVAAGKMGPLDPRPVDPTSLFPCYGVSRIATAAVVNAAVDARRVAFNQPVGSVWPAFATNGKQDVTVAEFLKCRSGVEGALPTKLSTYSSFSVEEVDNIAAQIAAGPYEVLDSLLSRGVRFDSGPRNPQELVAYLYYGWGWAAAGFVKALTTKAIQAAVEDVAAAAGVSGNLMLGIPADREDLASRAASIDLGKPDEGNEGAASDDASLPRGQSSRASEPPSPAMPGVDRQRSVAVRPMDLDVAEGGEEEASFSETTMATALAAVEIAGVLVEGGLENLKALTSGGKEHIMDPRIINCHKLKHGCIPSANMYATASALATLGGRLCESLYEKEISKVVPSAVVAACDSLGFRPVTFALPGSTVSADSAAFPLAREAEPAGFCMCALGGTMILCVPSASLAVAITVNQLSAQRSAALKVAKVVCQELGLGEPVDL